MSEWKRIETFIAPKKSREFLFYQPEATSGRMTLSARMIVERYPPAHHRLTTHWCELPTPPQTVSVNAAEGTSKV